MAERVVVFRGGRRTVAGFSFAVALVLVARILIGTGNFGIDAVEGGGLALEVGTFGLLGGVTWFFLRKEGVRLAELGLSSDHVPPAVVTCALAWAALNLLGVGVAVVTGHRWGLSLLRETLPEPIVATVVVQFLVVGMVEELVFRGYLQTKLIALFGDGGWIRPALGIFAASVTFGARHAPGALLAGASISEIVGVVAARTLSGIGFGVLYEATQNVYFVGLLHGIGNTWPLIVDWWNWSTGAFVGYLLGVLAIYAAAALWYRRIALRTDATPAVRRRDSATRSPAG